MGTTCAAKRKNGQPCQAKPIERSAFCFFHSPEKAEERQAASAAGGRSQAIRTLPADSPPIRARTPADLVNLLEMLISSVLTGLIDPRVANSVAILAGLQLKTLSLQIDQERLEALEASVESRHSNRV